MIWREYNCCWSSFVQARKEEICKYVGTVTFYLLEMYIGLDSYKHPSVSIIGFQFHHYVLFIYTLFLWETFDRIDTAHILPLGSGRRACTITPFHIIEDFRCRFSIKMILTNSVVYERTFRFIIMHKYTVICYKDDSFNFRVYVKDFSFIIIIPWYIHMLLPWKLLARQHMASWERSVRNSYGKVVCVKILV